MIETPLRELGLHRFDRGFGDPELAVGDEGLRGGEVRTRAAGDDAHESAAKHALALDDAVHQVVGQDALARQVDLDARSVAADILQPIHLRAGLALPGDQLHEPRR